jgi:hypothetical protein
MNGWAVGLIVLGYIFAGAVVTLVFLRCFGTVDGKMDINDEDCGYVAAAAMAWPLVLFGMLFALFGRCLIRIAKKGDAA